MSQSVSQAHIKCNAMQGKKVNMMHENEAHKIKKKHTKD
jgi:hypothetical protein